MSDYKSVGYPGLQRDSDGNYRAFFKRKKKTVKKVLHTTEFAVAKRKLKAMKEDTEKRDGVITFEDLIPLFVSTRKIKKSTYDKTYVWRIKRLREEASFFKKEVHKIPLSEFQGFLVGMKLNARSHNSFVEFLSMILKVAVENHFCAEHPFSEPKKLKVKWNRKQPRIPSPETHEKIVENIRSQIAADTREESANWVDFLGKAGIGEAEAAWLDWSDFDFEKRQFIANRKKTEIEFTVPFYPWLEPLVLRLWEEAGKPKKGKVFEIKSAKQAIYNACNRLGLRSYSPRNLRQMLIERLIRLGMLVEDVASYQGHKDSVLIQRTYRNVISEASGDHKKKALEALNKRYLESLAAG